MSDPAADPTPTDLPSDHPSSLPDASALPDRQALLIAAVAVSGAALAIVLAWTTLPQDWRVSIALGVLLLVLTLAVGLPLTFRARNDLYAARKLLYVATDRMREAYESLLTVNEQLRQTADARDQALAELRATVRQREAFLEAVAHDLKTPLTVIKGHADLLAGGVARGRVPDPAALARSVDRITDNAERMRVLIDELLALARLESSAPMAAHREPVDLVALARIAVANAGLTTPRHPVTLETGLAELTGEWDRQRLERLLANLLANAVNYSPEGGRVTVSVAAADDGATAVLTVRDEGIGIPEADRERIFDRFQRGGNVPSGVAGTGLGLASVRQIVELHGGTIAVESEEGRGSTFTVRLPLLPPDPVPMETMPGPAGELAQPAD